MAKDCVIDLADAHTIEDVPLLATNHDLTDQETFQKY